MPDIIGSMLGGILALEGHRSEHALNTFETFARSNR
jgi:hypothetical protein